MSYLYSGSFPETSCRSRPRKRKGYEVGNFFTSQTGRLFSRVDLQIKNPGFHNLTNSRGISPQESMVLSCGLNFIPTPSSPPDSAILADFTKFARTVRLKKWLLCKAPSIPTSLPLKRRKESSFEPPVASMQIENYLQNAEAKLLTALDKSSHKKSSHSLNNFPPWFYNTIKELRSDKDIMITATDKNLGLAVVDTSWYVNAALGHLQNTLSYRAVSSAPLLQEFYFSLRKILERYGLLLRKDGTLSSLASYLLTLEGSPKVKLCKFYLLKKIHKSPISTRPICSNTNYVTWHVSKYLDEVLKPLMINASSYVTNSQSLVSALEKRVFPSTCILLEADVDNLYPSIPINEGLRRLSSFLHRSSDFVHQKIALVIDLSRWILQNNYCTFEDKVYQQIQGTAMGTPFAVVYACIFLTSVECEVFSTISSNLSRPIFYKRYIDDIFAIFSSELAADNFVSAFNSISPSLHLTAKANGTGANFLDVTLFKGNRFTSTNILDVTLYQKPINKYVYLLPTSFHAKSVFRSFILGELRRYRINCSDDNDFLIKKNLFFDRLLARGYRPNEILKLFETVHDRQEILQHIRGNKRPISRATLNPVFVTTRAPSTLALPLRDCLSYPPSLFSDIHSSIIFSGNAPIVAFKGTKSLGEELRNRLLIRPL